MKYFRTYRIQILFSHVGDKITNVKKNDIPQNLVRQVGKLIFQEKYLPMLRIRFLKKK